jgi:purine catabolism regulator
LTTLKEILAIPRFSELSLLNNRANLDRPLDTVEVFETPDMHRFIQKNTLLITTGMVYQNQPEKLCELISTLSELPATGLAIKLGRFVETLDSQVLDLADQLEFPLIQIPIHMTLGDISQKLLGYIWDEQTEQIFYSLEIQQHFLQLLVRNVPLEKLLDELSVMLKQSMLLVDPLGDIRYSNLQYSTFDLFSEDGQNFLSLLKRLQKEKQEKQFLFTFEQEEKLVSVLPIETERYFPYVLVLFETDPLPYPFSKFAIKQALNVLSLAVHKELSLQTQQQTERKTVLQYFLTQSDAKNDDWVEYKKHFPKLTSSYYRIVTMEETISSKKYFHKQSILLLIEDYLLKKMKDMHQSILLFPTNEPTQWILLLQEKVDFLPLLEEIHHFVVDYLKTDTHFGIGDPVNDIDLISFSHKESLYALKENNGDTYLSFNKIKSIKYIAKNTPEDDIQYFCLSVLKHLAYPKNESDIDLRQTLKTYLDNQCEITKTAEKLFVHRNTVKYRIKKCEAIFHAPIHSEELSLQLRVALYLSEIKQHT